MNDEFLLAPAEISSHQTQDLSDYSNKVRQLVEASVASETRRAYSSRLRRFMNWCDVQGLNSSFPVSPEVLASYIANMAEDGLKYSTIEQTMAAISTIHQAQGLTSPTESLLVNKILKGCRREYGTAKKKHDAATAEVVRYLLNSIPEDSSPKNIRDRAIISLGFAGAFRRSELCELNAENLKWIFRGGQEILLIDVERSKTDQERRGMTKAIFPSEDKSVSPTELLKRWMNISSSEGALFTRILKGGNITSERLTS